METTHIDIDKVSAPRGRESRCKGPDVIPCAIDAAFLLAVAQPGQRLAEHTRAILANPRPSGLHFAPVRHTVWTDDTGLVALGVWQGGFGSPTEPGERWFVSERGIVASIGSLRWSGKRWSPEASWARQLSAAFDGTSLRDVTHDLRGVFSNVTLSSSGDGGIESDPFGFNFVYHGDNRALAAVSSRAALCAQVLADEGSRPARDHLAACWPAYSRHWIGERTGFSGVRLVRPGTVIKITSGEPPSIDVDRTPWMPADDLCDLTRSELFELAYEELADTVRSTLSLPGDSYRADLTGGKDTRLLASVVLGEGLADSFRFQTFGPPGLPDVRVATGHARRFGLDHEVRFEPPSYSATFDERMRSFVATTGGMANLWYQRARHDGWPEVRMSGTHGLLLRSKNRVDEHAESDVDLVRGLDKRCDLARLGSAASCGPRATRGMHS